jgi:hypothetical protein
MVNVLKKLMERLRERDEKWKSFGESTRTIGKDDWWETNSCIEEGGSGEAERRKVIEHAQKKVEAGKQHAKEQKADYPDLNPNSMCTQQFQKWLC